MTLPEIIILGVLPLTIIYFLNKTLFNYYVISIIEKPFTDIDEKDKKNKPNFDYLNSNIFKLSINHRNDDFNVWEIRYQVKYDDLGKEYYVNYNYGQPLVREQVTGQFYVWIFKNKNKAIKKLQEGNKRIFKKLIFNGERQSIIESLKNN